MTYHLSQRQIIKVTNGPKRYNTNSIKNLDLNQVKNWKNLPRQMEMHVSFYNENRTFQVTSNITQNHTRNWSSLHTMLLLSELEPN